MSSAEITGVTLNETLGNVTLSLHEQIISLANTLYYMVLIPVAFVGNTLSIAVVCFIARNQPTRRSIPDFCLGILAGLDLFSVLFVHSLTLGAMARGTWLFPTWVCFYQAFASSTYLKLEFLVQVAISVDRYFAVVRPLRYHRVSSLKTMRIILAIIVLISFGTTALSMGLDTGTVTYVVTWRFCILGVQAKRSADYVVITCTGLIFVFGFIAFIFCNFSLVRILRDYHDRKTDYLLKEISHAVHTMAKDPRGNKLASPTKAQHLLHVPESTLGKNPRAGPSVSSAKGMSNQSVSSGIPTRLGNSTSSNKINGTAGVHTPNIGVGQSIRDQFNPGNNIDKGEATNLVTNHIAPELRQDNVVKIESCELTDINLAGANTHEEREMVHLQMPGVQTNLDDRLDSRFGQLTTSNQDVNKVFTSESSIDSASNLLGISPSLFLSEATCYSNILSDALETPEGTGSPKTHTTLIDSDEESFDDNTTPPAHRGRSRSVSSCSSAENKNLKYEGIKKSASFIVTKEITPREYNVKSYSDSFAPVEPITVVVTLVNQPTTCPPVETLKAEPNRSPSQGKLSDRKNHLDLPSLPTITVSSDESAVPIVITDPEKLGPTRPNRLDIRSSLTSIGLQPEHVIHFQQNLQKFLKKVQKKAKRQKKELLLARLVIFCSTIFVATWVPYIVVLILGLANATVSQVAEDVALKLVFANAMLNPIFYGLCRKNYRKGYSYISQLFFHYVSCGLVHKPGDDKLFFESRRTKVKRHLEAANMEPRGGRRKSAHALQLLQHTLAVRSFTKSPVCTPKVSEFKPSSRLQDLFEKYMNDTSSDSDFSDTIDYDALIFAEDENMYENLKKMWSVCMYPDEAWSQDLDVDDDIELNVDYDAMVDHNRSIRGGSCGTISYGHVGDNDHALNEPEQSKTEFTDIGKIQRMAMSTPNFQDAFKKESEKLKLQLTCDETKL